MISVYLIGSLRNPDIPKIAAELRAFGFDVFDDWYAVGPEADDHWRDYEKARGHTFPQALEGYAANNTFRFDLDNLIRCDAVVLALPAGRSAHMELGFMLGQGKPGFILLDSHERWDVMYRFATGVFSTIVEIAQGIVIEHQERVRAMQESIRQAHTSVDGDDDPDDDTDPPPPLRVV